MSRASLAALADREVSVEEVRGALEDPIPQEERQEILDLHRWFIRRYATPESRLAYVRQAYARWTSKPRPPTIP